MFKLKRSASGWIFNTLYRFAGGTDGAQPYGRVAIGPDGAVYGTTESGGVTNCGGGSGCGTVFRLSPVPTAPKSAVTPWIETVLHRFNYNDGDAPQGALTFGQLGDIYGTTGFGGNKGWGTIYKLVPSGGSWTETVLYSVQNNGDGQNPYGGVVFDPLGHLYGTFSSGGPHGSGAIYQLSPSGQSWTEQTVYGFTGGSDGGFPLGEVTLDRSGNLYGGTYSGGTVFKLTPAGGGWTPNTLYTFPGGFGPQDTLLRDAAGNLYGTIALQGAFGWGSVFKLTPTGGGWTYTSLHDFTGDGPDGVEPIGGLVVDISGNLYGTASGGGTSGSGVIFEITP